MAQSFRSRRQASARCTRTLAWRLRVGTLPPAGLPPPRAPPSRTASLGSPAQEARAAGLSVRGAGRLASSRRVPGWEERSTGEWPDARHARVVCHHAASGAGGGGTRALRASAAALPGAWVRGCRGPLTFEVSAAAPGPCPQRVPEDFVRESPAQLTAKPTMAQMEGLLKETGLDAHLQVRRGCPITRTSLVRRRWRDAGGSVQARVCCWGSPRASVWDARWRRRRRQRRKRPLLPQRGARGSIPRRCRDCVAHTRCRACAAAPPTSLS